MSLATNAEFERLFAYHERTKHSWASVRAGPHGLDWDNQPNPFRTYAGAPLVELTRGADLSSDGTRAALLRTAAPDGAGRVFDRASLAGLLWHSLAISRWKQVRGTEFRYSLRVNPSSGNLHPTECHLAVAGLADRSELGGRLFHYRAIDHRLEERGRGDAVGALLAAAGAAPIAATQAVIAFTSIFWREAWKYRSRAYRYCLLDLGHAFASLAVAAATFGWRANAYGWFDDEAVARALALEGGDERPLLLVRIDGASDAVANASTTEASAPLVLTGGTPNRLSEDENHHPLLLGMHQSTELEAPLPECPTPAAREATVSSDGASEAGQAGEAADVAIGLDEMVAAHAAEPDESLAVTTRRRRSAIDHDPERSPMARAQFAALLAALRPEPGADWRADWRGNLNGAPGERFVSLYIYVHRVSDLPPGLYRFEPARGLLLLRAGDFRAQAARLSLEQTLAGNSTFAVSLVGDLERAAATFGCRAYRFVHTEAGIYGQWLYLAAESLGFQSTGIGAFYDDEVHRFLGLEGSARQVVYHFAVGRAAVDDRLLDVDGPVE